MGKNSHIAVIESGFQDSHDRSQWSFVVLAANQKLSDQIIAGIETDLLEGVDATLLEFARENL